MAILQPALDEYIHSLIPQRDEILEEMEDYAADHGFPIVGPQVGQVLMQYTKLIQPQRIFEMGSGYGYSAIWFARASGDDCKIYCTDMSEENEKSATTYFTRAGVNHKIEFLVDDAINALNQVEGNFDIIYCDIDKEGYPDAFEAAVPRLNKGGVLITDNTLWYGRVLESDPDDATKGIMEYNKLAFSHPDLLTVMLPVRDGVCVSMKLK